MYNRVLNATDNSIMKFCLPLTKTANDFPHLVLFSLCAFFANCICLACIVVIMCVFVASYVYLLYYVCITDAGLLARRHYPEGPATGHLDTGFSCFPCVYKQMLRWFPSFQVATTCLSCSPPRLRFLVFFIFVYM